MELGLGGSAISKALKKTCGLDNAGLKTLYSKYGDAGDVAFEAKKRQGFTLRKPKPLTIKSVYESLVKIANSKGQGSQEIKQRVIERLILDTRGAEESRYIVRTLVQHLRIGAVKTTMLIALSRAFLLSKPAGAVFETRSQEELLQLKKDQLNEVYHCGEEIVKACFARHPNYADIVPALLEVGVCDELLLRCGLTLHIPLRPMLGSITRDLGDMLIRLQDRDFACEYKYDGQRAQVHCDEAGKVTIFSRHLEVMTDKYPDLVAIVPTIRGEGVSSFILEGEVVAIDSDTGDLQPFQTLANRAKKDVAVHEIKVNVCLFAFDLMYLNEEELLGRSFRERRNLLRSLFVEMPNRFTWVKSLNATSSDSDAVQEFFKAATAKKCEGIMVKVLDNPSSTNAENNPDENLPQTPLKIQPTYKSNKTPSKSSRNGSVPAADPKPPSRRKALLATYEPDKRLDSWLKVKKDYHASADTIDLVPIAGWHGQGRKSKWWSPILLAAYCPSTGRLVAVTKCMSGFTDAFYSANRAKYSPDSPDGPTNVHSEQPAFVEYGGSPDVWFEPQEVWEIAFADVTLSPTYTAAIDHMGGERGLSLRFPRFLKTREDKTIEEASSEEFLADLYFKQLAKAPESAGQEEENEVGE
jgi:DNA ligase 1